MLIYLDASALVKRYVEEAGSRKISAAITAADAVGTSIISRAETVAALAKAVRVGTLREDEARAVVQVFRSEWPNFIRIQATELVVARADQLAWRFGLRGYDAVHLASALMWNENMNGAVVFATFDRRLWDRGTEGGLTPFPEERP